MWNKKEDTLIHLKTQLPNALFTNVHTCIRVLMLICWKFKYHTVKKKTQPTFVANTHQYKKKKLKYVTDLEGIHTMSFSVWHTFAQYDKVQFHHTATADNAGTK